MLDAAICLRGFPSGRRKNNPWSIINFLDKKKVGAYWFNTSSNRLISKLLREGSADTRNAFENMGLPFAGKKC